LALVAELVLVVAVAEAWCHLKDIPVILIIPLFTRCRLDTMIRIKDSRSIIIRL
jgi:hypothetical protein